MSGAAFRRPRGASENASTDLRPSTLSLYRVLGEGYIVPRLGGYTLGALRSSTVQEWVNSMVNDGVHTPTIHGAFRVLRSCVNAAVGEGLIPVSPVKARAKRSSTGIRLPEAEDKEVRALEPGEVAAIAEAIAPRYKALVLVGARCGLRWGELIGLRRQDVDLPGGKLRVRSQLTEVDGHIQRGPVKSKQGNRDVPLPRVAAEALATHMATYPPRGEEQLVFSAVRGGPLYRSMFRRKYWHKALEKAGIPKPWPTFHTLRHSAVSYLIASGAPVRYVQKFAGHASLTTTMNVYAHMLADADRKMAEGIDTIFREGAEEAPAEAQVVPIQK